MALGKVRLTGPLFDPRHADALKSTLAATLKTATAGTVPAIKAEAPVSKKGRDGKPRGTLRDSLDTEIAVYRRRIKLRVTSTAKSPKGFPYGASQAKQTQFVSEALTTQNPATIQAIRGAVSGFVAAVNAGTLPPSTPV